MNHKRLVALAIAALGLAVVVSPVAARWARAGDLLAQLAEPPRDADQLLEEDVLFPAPGGPVRARLYRSSQDTSGRGLVVSHGVHYRGIDEPRLVRFARALARSGMVVLTPQLDDLVDYRISERGVDVIEASVAHLAGRPEVSTPKVGLIGFSFAGGLSLVAAGRPALDDRVAFATSVGGHHDLARVLDFLVTGRLDTPECASRAEPHEYGLVILVYQYVERFVPPDDVETMQRALRAWLQEDPERARAIASQRTTAEGEQLFSLLERGALSELRAALLELLDARSDVLASLSPAGRLHDIEAPVYLLHGAHDSVIPPVEARWADRELAGQRHAALVTPLIEHVAVEGGASLGQKMELLSFMSRLL